MYVSLYKIYGNVGQGHKEGHVGKFSQFIHSSYIYFPASKCNKNISNSVFENKL